jgi:hypothetical protein
MRKISFSIVLLIFSLSILALGSNVQSADLQWKKRLHPKLRDLTNNINLFWITEKNLDIIWSLEDNPDRADIACLALGPEQLSSSMIDVLENWVTRGKGIIFPCITATKFLPMEFEKIGDCIGDHGGGHYGPVVQPVGDHPLMKGVETIFLSGTSNCSYGRTFAFVREKNQSYEVVGELTRESSALNGRAMVIAGVIDNGPGRFLSVGYGFEGKLDYFDVLEPFQPKSEAILVADNARFYLNALLWLMVRSVP